jgi:hypothetical protein
MLGHQNREFSGGFHMNNKGFLQMPFAWMFGLIVGAFILFLGIYFAVQLTDTSKTTVDVQTSKDIGILLNPLEIGFESGKTTFLELAQETRIYNNCSESTLGDEFGRQRLEVSQKSLGEWSDTGIKVSFFNKYIFSPYPTQGKTFIIFSKPFEFPFKVADLTYIIPKSKEYCFINAPEHIRDEIHKLKLNDNIFNVSQGDEGDCPVNSEKVCFYDISGRRSGCDTTINSRDNEFFKGRETNPHHYEGDALMYAGIFADSELYECQFRRLMKRTSSLAQLYEEKSLFIMSYCHTNLNLIGLRERADALAGTSSRLMQGEVIDIMKEVERANRMANCKLW